ncbi:MAG: PAS domain S-box protein [Bacteroidota bacterium]|nr:PAS domain S-box protein [Bacteroidota bacterium]
MIKLIKNFLTGIRVFYRSMGLLEQAQIVASTAVIVAMITLISVRVMGGEQLGLLDFISVVTVGVFGYVSIYFALNYGRTIESQRRELLELNTIAEAVNYSVDLNNVLQSALVKVMQLMHADVGWIYLFENHKLILKHSYGTSTQLFPADLSISDEASHWIRTPGLQSADTINIQKSITAEFAHEGMKILASIPLVQQGSFAGALIISSKDPKKFERKKVALIQAFGNQISMALNNASLFEQVRQSEQLYADLYENSPDMYHSVDRRGYVVSCNQTESQLLGIPKERILGNPLLNLYPSSQHKHLEANLKKIFEHGQELKGIEEQIQRSDGTLIDVSVNTSLVYDSDGKPTIARMVLRDITEKKKMEAKILQAQKIDSIGNLAGGIAHDFNNILTAILGSASIMRRRILDNPRLVKYVDLIETTSRRGAAVTRQLLTFARKSNPHITRTDVNMIIDQTLKLFEVTTPKTIHIKCNLSKDPLIVEADEGQIQQALLNLCLNARDAMPQGGIIVINSNPIDLNQQDAAQLTDGNPGAYAMITVADSGAGIPPELLHRIYEPFFTTKDQGKGTGLGLSVVYGVVKGNNGYINVSSEVNSGTMFSIFLPRVSDTQSKKGEQLKPTEIIGGKEHILMIEDEISVGEVGTDILEELGYKTERALNGREAISKLETSTTPFDLIILDMNMPRMGGRATFEYIKKHYPTLKVLVCSGYSATMLDDGKFTQSIDGFIQKPYEVDDFAGKVRSILDAPSNIQYPNNDFQ